MRLPDVCFSHRTSRKWLIGVAASRSNRSLPQEGATIVGTQQHRYDVEILAGRQLPEPLDRFYVEVDYLYSFVEQVMGVDVDRSSLVIETVYFASPRLLPRLFDARQKTHGGRDLPEDYQNNPKLYYHHDETMRIDFIQMGTGAACAVNAKYTLSSSIFRTVWGEGGHEIDYEITFGVTRAF